MPTVTGGPSTTPWTSRTRSSRPHLASQSGQLLDAIDWVDEWPTVNGGAWASDSRMPAPAGQPGGGSRHGTRVVNSQEPGRLLFADEFSGPHLDSSWSWVREEEAGYQVAAGVLS